jgi:hypothetical protein
LLGVHNPRRNGTATLQQAFELARALAFVTDEHVNILWMMLATAKALVYDCSLGFNACQALDLCDIPTG